MDRVLIYVTLYITECLKRLQRCSNKNQGTQEMYSLAISKFDIPGDTGFPLNAVYARPQNTQEAGKLYIPVIAMYNCTNIAFRFNASIFLTIAARNRKSRLRESFQQ